MAHDGVADRAGGVVVIDVDAIGAEFGEPHVDIFTPVIDCGLIAELFDAEALLGRAAGDPDGAATVDIRDLSGSRAHRACGGRDDDGFALLRLSDYREGGMSRRAVDPEDRSEEHTSELQSLMRISYAVFCLKKQIKQQNRT